VPDFNDRTAEYQIRDAEEADIPGIVRLHFEIEPDDNAGPQEYETAWRWLHDLNPYSTKKVLVGIDQAGQVVAHTAMFPLRFQAKDRVVLGGFPDQLMVAENLRQTLLFPNLETKFLREYRSVGVDFLYGLVNRGRVLRAHLALGYHQLGIFQVYARPYRLTKLVQPYLPGKTLRAVTQPVLAALQPVLRLSGHWRPTHLKIFKVDKFGPEIDSLAPEACQHFSYYALRDAHILNWRFAQFPNRQYLIYVVREQVQSVGYIVLRRMNMMGFDVLAIVDILFQPDRADVGRALLNTVHEEALRLRVDMSACLLNPGSALLPALKAYGYLKTPEVFTLIVHEPKRSPLQFSEDQFTGWHVTWFDHDYV
jgi:hypothetical protein